MEKPKRPLSAYNLYCRYKHIVLCEVIRAGGAPSLVDVCALLRCDVGMEGEGSDQTQTYINKAEQDSLRRQKVRSVLENNLLPSPKRRRHRKSHGLFQHLSFKDVNNILSEGWKNVDPFLIALFDELADQGRCFYYAKMRSYHNANPGSAPKQPYRPVVRKNKKTEMTFGEVCKNLNLVFNDSGAENGTDKFNPSMDDFVQDGHERKEV